MLGLLAHKWRWGKRRQAEVNRTISPIVMGADVHMVCERFIRYFDVELKLIPRQEETCIVSARMKSHAVERR
jgi:glutamate decarboxylase